MTIDDAVAQLKAILGRGLYPAAIPRLREVLHGFKESVWEAAVEETKATIREWYDPAP